MGYLEITTNKFSRRTPPKTHRVNVFNVPIPDTDRMVHQFTGPDLYKEAKRLMVPDIAPLMGWQEICLRLAIWLDEKSEVAAK
jgi:hypothetical protein